MITKIDDTFYFNNPFPYNDALIIKPHTITATYPAPTGQALQPVYGERINDEGERVLEIIGETNQYDKIQASLDSTKIEDIIRRYEAGDITILEKSKGQYIDATKLPKDMLTAQNNLIALQEQFNALSLQAKEQFGMDFNKFLKALEKDEIPGIPGNDTEDEIIKDTKDKEVDNNVK